MTEQDEILAFIARLCLVLIFPISALSKIFDYQSAMTGRGGFVGSWRHARDSRSFLHPVRFLSLPGGAAIHFLRNRDSGPVSQLLELSLQQ